MVASLFEENFSLYRDIVEVLSDYIYTYPEEEGLIYDEAPFDDFEWRTGATKVCVMTQNLVFKTSFSGYVYDYDYETSEYYDEPRFEDWEEDYCKMEYKLYLKALEEGLGDFFAETCQVDEGVYAQERCDFSFSDYYYSKEEPYRGLKYTNEDFDNILTKNNLYPLTRLIGRRAMRYLLNQASIDLLQKLRDFFNRYDINDLHDDNFGWFGQRIKFFDFSGYKTNTNEKLKEA